MISVTERTRRKTGAVCCVCRGEIDVGARYHELVGVGETDIWSSSWVRLTAHPECVAGDPCWELTTPAVLRLRAARSLDYVRRTSHPSIRPGQRCTAVGRPGIVTGGSGPHILVRLDSERHATPYHPSEVKLVDDVREAA